MRWSAAGCVLAATMILGPPVAADAQTTWQDVQVADIETMHEKFKALAEAFSEAQYAWRPMEGVRSVGEVLGLAVAEAHLFPTAWGYEAPATSEPGFMAELERAGGLSKSDMVEEIDASFAFLIAVVRDMPESKRTEDGAYFGEPMPVHASIATAMADMHEHLGQLIAYARTNNVVPPWSMGNG